MIYVILNTLAFIFFLFYTKLIDSKTKSDSFEISSIAITLLLLLVESGLLLITLFFHSFWIESLETQVLRIIYCFDGFFFISLSMNFITFGAKKKYSALRVVTVIFGIILIYIVFRKFTALSVDTKNGIKVTSDYLFSGEARKYFSWTWESLYKGLFKCILPAFCYISYLLLQENKSAVQLEKYQGIIIGEGLVLMWIANFAIKFISTQVPSFTLLYLYPYLFLFAVLFLALSKTSVPSGKGLFVTLLKYFISYVLPAALVGLLCMFIQPKGSVYEAKFLCMFGGLSILAIILSFKSSDFLSSSSKLYTADYEAALEKDLASIDYSNVEMDTVTEKMYEIFRRNVEASSMGVYILNSHNELEMAYSSNNVDVKIPVNNPIFDTLLNINKSVVVWSEIEKEHSVSAVQKELTDFFELTKSDALFILNEGHNIFGIITLGKLISGDHYKEYDYNVFVKLYSYFFVFGYYMRNISNKEIISVVNREIKMSSQIITSIQENIDHIKTNKVDVGYLMVPAHNIGGEFIDLIRLTENRHLFVVGDLAGKGIAASMNMVILKSIIRTYLSETHDFKELVVKINTFVRESLRKGTIFAGLFALVDFETDTMYYINCGIPALMMYTQVYNNVIEIQGSGHILGFVKDITPFLSVKTTKLNRGDIILACTDGMIQSHSLRGEQFGKERVQQALLDNSTYPAQRMAQFTFDGLLKFMSKEMEDDVSILILKYETNLEFQSDEETAQPPIEGSLDIPQDAVVEEPVVSESEVVTDSAAESEPVVEEPAAEETTTEQTAAEETATEEPAKEESAPASDNDGLPEGFEMPDLSDLDDLMKEAGL